MQSRGYLGRALSVLLLLFASTSATAGRFVVTSESHERRIVSEIRAAHFLTQATFGPSMRDISNLAVEIRTKGYKEAIAEWIDEQFALPPTLQTPTVIDMLHDNGFPDFENQPPENVNGRFRADAWWHNAISAKDQLRQRIAWALAQIFVVNDFTGFNSTRMEDTGLPRYAGYSTYYDIFVNNAFGNYRTVLGEVTTHPIMGFFLTHLNNRRADPANEIFPDENYAREVMQLFTIGLHKVQDQSGELARDANGQLIPTYDNEDIKTMARVFTGYTFDSGRGFPGSPAKYTAPMRMVFNMHDRQEKVLLDGTVLRRNRRPETDVSAALDMLFNQPETPPFVARLLIQRMTHSNPSRSYVQNVARWFQGGRRGTRGDMKAVVKAILLSPEATGLRIRRIRDEKYNVVALEVEGRRDGQTRLREPVIRFTSFIRAFEGESEAPQGRFHIGDARSYLNQSPYKSPSVFNFYSPDFQPAGPMKAAQLVGPEFEIMTSVSINKLFNTFRDALYRERIELPRVRGKAANIELNLNRAFRIADVSERDEFIASLPELMEHLDILLCQGTMSEEFKQKVIQEVTKETRPTATLRVREDMVKIVIGLVLTSPDCAIVD